MTKHSLLTITYTDMGLEHITPTKYIEATKTPGRETALGLSVGYFVGGKYHYCAMIFTVLLILLLCGYASFWVALGFMRIVYSFMPGFDQALNPQWALNCFGIKGKQPFDVMQLNYAAGGACHPKTCPIEYL